MTSERISADFIYPEKHISVYGSNIHFIEAGVGDPILFLHGIPTSSYIWRNIIPHLTSLGRCIAPDLIGFGRSDKPDIEYSIFDHIKYIDKFIESLNLKNITLIMHGWGSIIGFDYATKHAANCKGLVFYEAFLRSLNNEEAALPFQEQMMLLQEQEGGELDFAKDGISFVDKIIPQTVMRPLSNKEMDNYRKPFLKKGSGKPLLQYLNELLKNNDDNKINKLIDNYTTLLTKSKLPKLMLYSLPGFITTMDTVMWAKETLPNLEVVDIGEELHLAQESCPQLIGETISVWLQGVEQAR